FTAGEADFCDAQAHKHLDQAQVFVDAQLGILRTQLACAAIDTIVVAAVGEPWFGSWGRETGKGSSSHVHLQGYTVCGARACRSEIRETTNLGESVLKGVWSAQSMRGVPLRRTMPVMPKTTMMATAIQK